MGSKRASLRMAFVVGAVLLLAQHMAVEGVVISVSWQQNTLLLESTEGFSLVAVDPAGEVRDVTGATRPLGDLRPGDVVECQGELFGTLLIAHKLRVISSAGDAQSDQQGYRSPDQPHGSRPPASQWRPTRHE